MYPFCQIGLRANFFAVMRLAAKDFMLPTHTDKHFLSRNCISQCTWSGITANASDLAIRSRCRRCSDRTTSLPQYKFAKTGRRSAVQAMT